MRLHDIIRLTFSLAILISFFGCENKFKTTDSGLSYKYIHKGKGPEFKNGLYVVFNADVLYENDSVLYTWHTNEFSDMLEYNDTLWDNSGQMIEGLKKLKVGDSAIFKISCYDLYERTWNRQIPINLNGEATLTVHVGIQNLITPDEFSYLNTRQRIKHNERIKKQAEDQLYEDIALMDEYFEINGIVPMETESGLRYEIHEPGDGIHPNLGDQVTVHYRGYLLDGTAFMNTYEKEPIKFSLGTSRVIQGWIEGVKLVSKGARFTLYIPSGLAYGPEGQGNLVKPNQILICESEFVDIKIR